jgi:hypothetical protein
MYPSGASGDREARVLAELSGLGAVGLDDAMVDRPIYQRALELLSWSRSLERSAALS